MDVMTLKSDETFIRVKVFFGGMMSGMGSKYGLLKVTVDVARSCLTFL